jgi:hypothetical protein
MSEAPDDAVPLDALARELHEIARLGIEGCPAWEDLDKTDPWEAGLVRIAYERARDLIAMSQDGPEA